MILVLGCLLMSWKPIENHWSRIYSEACASVLLNASATHLCRSISCRMAEVFYKHKSTAVNRQLVALFTWKRWTEKWKTIQFSFICQMITTNLHSIHSIPFISVCVFTGIWTHDLLIVNNMLYQPSFPGIWSTNVFLGIKPSYWFRDRNDVSQSNPM